MYKSKHTSWKKVMIFCIGNIKASCLFASLNLVHFFRGCARALLDAGENLCCTMQATWFSECSTDICIHYFPSHATCRLR